MRMPARLRRRVVQALLPQERVLGEKFLAETERGALRGWRAASGMAVVAGVLFFLTYRLILPERFPDLVPSLALLVLLGLASTAASHTRWGRRHPRGASLVFPLAI